MNEVEGLAEEVAVLALDGLITELARRSIAFLPDEEWAKLFDVNGMPVPGYAAEVLRVYKKKLKKRGRTVEVHHEAAPALAVRAARQRLALRPGAAERITDTVFAEVVEAEAAIADLFGYPHAG
jgi:Fe2+ transport system protein FeoA